MLSESQMQDTYNSISYSLGAIKNNPSQKNLNDLKDELDKFFSDSKCLGVIYTENNDKLFFGLYIMPKIDSEDVIKTITNDKRYKVDSYFVELDSKLFKDDLNLTRDELTCLLIHDIGALVNTSAPSEEVVKSIDLYLSDNHIALKLSNIVHYREILSFGFRDALRKCSSIFEIGNFDKAADSTMIDFMKENNINYEEYIDNAMSKINKIGYNYNREVNTKFIVLSWIMRVYNDVLGYRIPALKTLERMQELSPSQIERKECNNFARRLNRIDDDMLLEDAEIGDEDKSANIIDDLRNKYFKRIYTTNFISNLDIAKDDLVGIALKQENLEPNEPDAIPDLLNSINHSMMMVKDYAENNVDDKDTYKQWDGIYQELAKRRAQITRQHMYEENRKMINTYKNQNDQ